MKDQEDNSGYARWTKQGGFSRDLNDKCFTVPFQQHCGIKMIDMKD